MWILAPQTCLLQGFVTGRPFDPKGMGGGGWRRDARADGAAHEHEHGPAQRPGPQRREGARVPDRGERGTALKRGSEGPTNMPAGAPWPKFQADGHTQYSGLTGFCDLCYKAFVSGIVRCAKHSLDVYGYAYSAAFRDPVPDSEPLTSAALRCATRRGAMRAGPGVTRTGEEAPRWR